MNLINGVSNNLILSEEQILTNLQGIQANNEIEVSDELEGMHFSVEMETGTGKTYVYLRTIYELNKLYCFKKFVIVMPSVAISRNPTSLSSRSPEMQNLVYLPSA